MTLQDVLSRLEKVKPMAGGHMARCPAHEDATASLSVTEGTDGRILLHCHANCETAVVVEALSLTMRDLFPESRDREGIGDPTAIYDYKDEHGTLLFQALRYPLKADGKKTFRQRHPDESGGWIWKMEGVRRVVYHLDQLQQREAVLVVEGEKDADRLWALGLPATTNSGGAGKWRDDFSAQLVAAGIKRVVVLPDNDPPGDAHALAVARSCAGAGLAVKLLRLPGLPEKGDVSDWLNHHGHTKEDLVALLKHATPLEPPAETETAPAPVARPRLAAVHVRDVILDLTAKMAEGKPPVVPTPFSDLNYLFNGGFAPGELVFLGARPGVGKTALALQIAQEVAQTDPVLFVSREMVNTALARRMISQNGRVSASDLRRHYVSSHDTARFNESIERLGALHLWLTDEISSLVDLERLAATPPSSIPWKLIIVDYLQLVRAPTEIKDRRLQVEHVSQGLKGIATTHKIPVLCLTSLRRPQQGNARPTTADLRESGELEHDADIIILLHKDETRENIVEAHVAKNRDGETGSRDLVFIPQYVLFQTLERS